MISVCVATYNGEKYIHEQIDSILKELGVSDEVIISDDGSSDKTIEIINNFNDPRIKLFHHNKKKLIVKGNKTEKNISYVSSNVQNAILNASGDIIFLADQDDIWQFGRVSKVINEFKDVNIPKVVVCDCTVIDSNQNIICSSYFKKIKPSGSIMNTILKNPYLGCCMCFNRNLVDYIFPFPNYSIGHDLWIGLIGKLYGKVCFLNEPLVLYRRHSMTVTESAGKSTNGLWFKIKYRINLAIIIARKLFLF